MDCTNYESFYKEGKLTLMAHKKKFDSQPPSCSPLLMRARAERRRKSASSTASRLEKPPNGLATFPVNCTSCKVHNGVRLTGRCISTSTNTSLQGDPSGWLKPPVDLVPTVLADGWPLLQLPTLLRQDGGTSQIQVKGRFQPS